MYGIVLLAAALTGPTTPAWDGSEGGESLRDVKRAVEALRRDQQDARVDELKDKVDALRRKKLQDQIDEIRRMVQDLKGQRPQGAGPAPWPMPPANRAIVRMHLPPGITLVAEEQEVPVRSADPTFITPALEPGRDYTYHFRATLVRDGKPTVRTRRVSVRAGADISVPPWSEWEAAR